MELTAPDACCDGKILGKLSWRKQEGSALSPHPSRQTTLVLVSSRKDGGHCGDPSVLGQAWKHAALSVVAVNNDELPLGFTETPPASPGVRCWPGLTLLWRKAPPSSAGASPGICSVSGFGGQHPFPSSGLTISQEEACTTRSKTDGHLCLSAFE